ncbi:elongation factor P maturation arginine rhamnosyltransferase EarP [Rhizobacter sp. SG703]|uniref:elongation factor P maturation arginine rhamnosyltransferase EarP n=1 Tax=Rhizobacter sp. SG703 TaxID=2587140 RepID=UPI00144710AF|nr:elongation factor P maturation arginine rhamnosyltransferase EarP [Rhizobacter sp. SG703]
MPRMPQLQWDLFCRVVDNFGDVGVCWRLAADLAARGERVRLWVDDARALAWMAPGGAAGVELQAWPDAEDDTRPVGDVVVEAFGCELPPAVLVRIAEKAAEAPRKPVWINLEYLSAEGYVERSHRLRSPQMHGPARGFSKWFFYPGFTAATGGLLREPELMAQREAFDRDAWLAAHRIAPQPGEQLASLFCYQVPSVEALLGCLDHAGHERTLLLVPGTAPPLPALPPSVRVQSLPYLTQPDFDRLLWACDLNFVRGEDSLVRALWAGRPFIWQIYPQHDGVHELKLQAFLDRFDASPDIRAAWRAWNGLQAAPVAGPDRTSWQAQCLIWRKALLAQTDLASQLLSFVAESL